MPKLFTGLHHPSAARHFARPDRQTFHSVETLWGRKSDFIVGDWVLDSGAFMRHRRGLGHRPVKDYAAQARRWKRCGNLLAVVCQDFMCESVILEATGLTIADHQRLTIENYDALLHEETGCYIMPVLQGYAPQDYVNHIRQYGDRLKSGMWAGVGSVCKRNGNPKEIEDVLLAIHAERPDLLLHGFGLKATALKSGVVDRELYSCDSMAWSIAARYAGLPDNWLAAESWTARILSRPVQQSLF